MKFQVLITIFLGCVLTQLNGQQLSEKAQISLLTYSPTSEVYTTFGHSSFRVFDPANRFDIVYNYGTFNWNEPNFILNFIRGKLNYFLATQDFNRVVQVAKYRNQTLEEQVFALDQTEKQAIFDFLQNNYKPENRYYLYDFFFDNCATIMRDVVDTTYTSSIAYDKEKVTKNVAFRDLLREFTAPSPWLNFGIDLALGLPADKIATFEEQMFLPKYLNESFAVATITTTDTIKALVSDNRILTTEKPLKESGGFPITPTSLFWLIFGFTLLINIVFKSTKFTNFWNGLFIIITGIAGLILTLMWFGTDHAPTKNNLNILWAFPFHIVAAFWFWQKPKAIIATYKTIYFQFFTVLNLLLLLSFSFFPQDFHAAIIPILLTLVLMFGRKSVGRNFQLSILN
jgi:hypothetical protein